MVFTSPIFLFGFLPILLCVYFLAPKPHKNTILLLASLFFYAWGEVFYVAVMIVSILVNYFVARLIQSARENNSNYGSPKFWLTIGLLINVGLLISFKYANFVSENLNVLFSWIGFSAVELTPIHLPIGISFFTFQAVSYIVDVYRKQVKAQEDFHNLALYISLFPQLIAGPIVRYADIHEQIEGRTHSIELFSSGVSRFIVGLAKKMIIANPMGELADNVFMLSGGDLTMPLAWLGIIAYTLQIYFDFSGYSDMAIGLGRMFGFHFLENFNFPYIARSMKEFWRRWHISLSTWFRDYVYISLGGNRGGAWFVYRNLLIVFLLTGIWHGASWNFVVWGLFHGFFLSVERFGFSSLLARCWRPLQHVYVMLIVMLSWVFFRADTLPQALDYLFAMTDFSNLHTSTMQYQSVVSDDSLIILLVATLCALPVLPWLKTLSLNYVVLNKTKSVSTIKNTLMIVLLSVLFYLCILKVAASTYNPFIYFRF